MMTDGKPSDSNSLSSWIIPGAAIIYIAVVWILTLYHFYEMSLLEIKNNHICTHRQIPKQFYKMSPSDIKEYIESFKQIFEQVPQIYITIIWILLLIIYFAINYCKHNKNIFIYTTFFIIIISLLSTYEYSFLHFTLQSSKQTVYTWGGWEILLQAEFIWGGLIISSWLSTILAISYLLNNFSYIFINKITDTDADRHKDRHKFVASVVIIIIVSLLSMAVYFFPKTRISADFLKRHDLNNELLNPDRNIVKQCREGTITSRVNLEKITLNKDTILIMEKEHEKAVAEIDQRTEIDDSWFHKKFLLVGGLFAAFLAYFSPFNPMVREKTKFSPRNEKYNRWKELTDQISDMFRTNVPSSILGLAFIISLAIDIHIRHNQMITQQLGLWIMYFVDVC